ncbi:hypothetical protein GWI33_005848 [Rhynchophorus ferrugineus]|uniref:Uncharacterized protein n=1 Tax=Rhynchophorus ferrugineus TaxID=354439 RepID=A0A834IVC8_RHYFE|nr:hypothetical protein GWI33_005848 [Rhynchophorus ferrugineus]
MIVCVTGGRPIVFVSLLSRCQLLIGSKNGGSVVDSCLRSSKAAARRKEKRLRPFCEGGWLPVRVAVRNVLKRTTQDRRWYYPVED